MNEKEAAFEPDNFLKNLPLQSEEIGYKQEELISCQKCARTNPPTRLKCFYCGEALELSAEQAGKMTPVLRKLENWEKGFNLILRTRGENCGDETLREIARLLNLETDVLQKILAAGKCLPLVRTESIKEAEIVQRRLAQYGIESSVAADSELDASTPPRRLRGLHFEEDKLYLFIFNRDEVVEISRANFCLMVTGAVFQKEVEATEKRKKGESKILNTSETASDEFLLDLYDRTDATGYRISVKGFDFTCLEAEKGILARENIQKLIDKLQRFAPEAKLVNDYLSLREILGGVWEVEQRRDSQGLKRSGFGRFDLANTLSSSNLQQFTKYSRLHWLVLNK